MPRIPRGLMAGYAYHFISRGNGRAEMFHKAADYKAFVALLSLAKDRFGIKIFAFCLMPNRFHLVVEPPTQTAPSQFVRWLLTSRVRRYHRRYESSGHMADRAGS